MAAPRGPAAPLRALDWDSEFFGCGIARVERDRLDDDALAAVEWERRRRPYDCVYFLADATDAATHRRVAGAGWRFIDVRTTLALPLHAAREVAVDHVRPSADGDRGALVALAAASHGDSRFYRDGRFPRERCDALFAAWMEKSLDGVRADAVLVPRAEEGGARGYVTLLAPDANAEAEIGLFAVAPEAQGRGLGTALLAAARTWAAARGARSLRVVTQGANARALRAYERAGFRTRSVAYWYHAWL